jgi:UrcA family protein
MIMNTKTQTSNLSRVTATALFGALTLSFAAICSAQDSPDALQQKVKYADLDVSRTAGANALYARISMAANNVCRDLNHGDLATKVFFNRCVDKAVSDAVAKVDQPALYSVYSAKYPAPKPVMLAAGLAH